jgi:DNA replication and repair protein RecF
MFLEKISILNFKNHKSVDLVFSERFNCLLGQNGAGKTNLLDAIFYLSFFKSAFNHIDHQSILIGESFFRIDGVFHKNNKTETVHASLKSGEKKLLKHNKIICEKISEHIGRFPAVMITPYDTDLVREGSEMRRKFIDAIISQTDKTYLEHLIRYNHYLKQRNALLKQFYEKRSTDHAQLEPYNFQIISLGLKIYERRNLFMNQFLTIFQHFYKALTNSAEEVSLTYTSDCENVDFATYFYSAYEKDYHLQRTTLGIHTDDYEFKIGDASLKKFGSQGQQKSFVIALKLAQTQYIYDNTGLSPILLLDDIFDKLDDSRIAKLISIVTQSPFGQLFITDARPERSTVMLTQALENVKLFHLNNGEIEEM